jgi:uncharacterized protein (TIGR03083 family)
MARDVSTSSLQAGFVELASLVRALHGDWSAAAPGYDGWTCKDLLAHLSSTQASLPAIAGSIVEPKKPRSEGGSATPFDPDRWNASQIRKRAEKDAQELLDEFDSGTTKLVDVLTDLPLDQPVAIGAYSGFPAGAAMAHMLEHQRHHVEDLRRALHGQGR